MQGNPRTLVNEKSLSGHLQIAQLPGPPGLPLVGNLLQLSTEKLHQIFEQWSEQYGPIYKIKLGSRPVVILTGPESIQYVLKNRPEKFRRLAKMDDVMREVGVVGIFNSEGEDWKRQRKLVSQALNVTHLKTFFPDMVNITANLLNRWNRLSGDDSSIEIKSELMRFTVDVTSRLAFGYNMNTIGKKEDVIQQHLEVIFPALFTRTNNPVPYWRFFKLPADRKLEKSLSVIQETMLGIINQTRAQLLANPGLKHQPSNFLQALLAASESENPVSNQLIIGNVLTLLLAGEDTTAHTLAWIFYFMHLHPGVQKKMRLEADRVLGNDTILRSYDDADKLSYIEAVALEAMRMKPVAPVLFFDALEDVLLEGVDIPKGTAVFLETHYAGKKAEHFSDPDNFIPERWMHGGCPAHSAHNERAFVPFGGGPRFCPGYKLAMLEITSVLVMACKNFEVKMETSPAYVHEILAFTMMPSDFTIRLIKRG
jgi:cytochrome P450